MDSINYIIAYNDEGVLVPWKFKEGEVLNGELSHADQDLYFVKQHDSTKDWKIYLIESHLPN